MCPATPEHIEHLDRHHQQPADLVGNIALLHALAFLSPVVMRLERRRFLFSVATHDAFQLGIAQAEVLQDLTVDGNLVKMLTVSPGLPDEIEPECANRLLGTLVLGKDLLCFDDLGGRLRLTLSVCHRSTRREDALRDVLYHAATLGRR